MPTISSSNVPTPKSWDEFEDITLAAAKIRWGAADFYRNGRQGQKQDGVDIWGHDEDSRHIGIQCKNTIDGISLAIIEAEAINAEKFTPVLDRLYIATSAKRDAVLQKDVRVLSQTRASSGRFKIDILFWDDICHDLSKDDDVFFQHYPQLKNKTDPVKEHDRSLFEELTGLLNSDGVIGFLDRNNMAGFSFKLANLEPLQEFYYKWNVPEREFIIPDLESVKKKLWDATNRYLEIIAIETFPTHNLGWQTVPPEWEHEQPERFSKVVESLHSLAGEIVSLHTEMVRTGRKYLVGSHVAQ